MSRSQSGGSHKTVSEVKYCNFRNDFQLLKFPMRWKNTFRTNKFFPWLPKIFTSIFAFLHFLMTMKKAFNMNIWFFYQNQKCEHLSNGNIKGVLKLISKLIDNFMIYVALKSKVDHIFEGNKKNNCVRCLIYKHKINK